LAFIPVPQLFKLVFLPLHLHLSTAMRAAFVYLLVVGLPLSTQATSYSATYLPSNAPAKSEVGQAGTNKCGSNNTETSECQNAYINALDDFCLWAPPSTHSSYGSSAIANTEQIEVAWCLRDGYGTRSIPAGAITGAHWIQTPDYVQITGMGDLTKLNIPAGDEGGELDPHGYDGLGNPIGGLVFGSSYNGTLRQYHEWTNFMSSGYFCFRACIDGPNAPKYCGHIWDTIGCGWNMPGDYDGGFTSCAGDSTEPMGIYVSEGANGQLTTSTFHQGDPVTPAAHVAGKSSNCITSSTLPNVGAAAPTATASLLPSSVSSSLARASSIAAASASSLAGVTTSTPAAGSSAASQTSATTRSSGSLIPSATSAASSASAISLPTGLTTSVVLVVSALVGGVFAL